jgi:hypothetical protein
MSIARHYPKVHDWFIHRFSTELSQASVAETAIQRVLVILGKAHHPDATLAQLSLRCFISHQIRKACLQLTRQFGHHYGFTVTELLPFVLDDDGRFATPYRPFAMEILETYDAQKAQLSTWAIRLTKNHGPLNEFLLERGLYRVSDWAILNDTTPQQLQRIFQDFHRCSASEMIAARNLLQRYHQVYRCDRNRQRPQKRQGLRCVPPTQQQLQQISPEQPPELVLAALQDIAEQLRQYRIYIRSGNAQVFQTVIPFDDLKNFQPEDIPDVENINLIHGEEDHLTFVKQYQADLEQCLQLALRQVLQRRLTVLKQRNLLRAQAYLEAVRLFHREGLSMAAIATQLTQQFAPQLHFHNQVQITRLLKLRHLRAEVREQMLKMAKTCVYQQVRHHVSGERLQAIRPMIDPIVTQAVDQIIAEAAAEAQTSNRRFPKSWFARQLCQVVQEFSA